MGCTFLLWHSLGLPLIILNHNKITMEASLINSKNKCSRRLECAFYFRTRSPCLFCCLHLLRHLPLTAIGRFFTRLLNWQPCIQIKGWFRTRLLGPKQMLTGPRESKLFQIGVYIRYQGDPNDVGFLFSSRMVKLFFLYFCRFITPLILFSFTP